jgi:hypothetical protein
MNFCNPRHLFRQHFQKITMNDVEVGPTFEVIAVATFVLLIIETRWEVQ